MTVSTETLLFIIAFASLGSTIFSCISVCVLITMSQQANKYSCDAAGKVKEVKEQLSASTDTLAKESTLQQLIEKI